MAIDDDDSIDSWDPNKEPPTLLQMRRDGIACDELVRMRDAIYAADGFNVSNKSAAYIRAYYQHAFNGGRIRGDQGLPSATRAVDPGDLDHRSQLGDPSVNVEGSYGAARSILARPIVTAEDWKRAAMAGGYDEGVRNMLRAKANLVGSQVLEAFERAWEYGETKLDDEQDAQLKMRSRAAQMLSTPGRSNRDTVIAKLTPSRSKK
jgi:hypothetical protein